MPIKRSHVGACAVGDSLYVVGGHLQKDGSFLNVANKYDTTKCKWVEIAPLPKAITNIFMEKISLHEIDQ